MDRESKNRKLAKHFGAAVEDFVHRHGSGWYYKGKFLGRDFHDVQCSPNWALKKLPGRDLY